MVRMFFLKSAYKKTLALKSFIFKDKGFSLLEVMVSVVIIAIIFVSLFRMQSAAIKVTSAIKFNTIAPALARQLLVQIESDIVNWSKDAGDFGEDFPGFEWTCDILDAQFEEIDVINKEHQKRFKKITIEIKHLVRQRSYKITTWRLCQKDER